MAASPPRPASRQFVPATIGACHWQTATDRYGKEAKAAIRDRERLTLGLTPLGFETPFEWPATQYSEDEDDENSVFKLVPSTQKYRNNLTALSQTYNLYFVAYQSQIFVYVPRSIAKQRLPSKPDLRLLARPTRAANFIGGYVDDFVPHSINHLVTGQLGDEEIVVASCDDGDVYAYYVKEIADWIATNDPLSLLPRSRKRRSLFYFPKPQPFFRENVGISAWGLAIHQKSRLIAVSSNRSEITVFAPALTTGRGAESKKHPVCSYCYHCEEPEVFVRERTRNWRIIVALGPSADNIPNICFIDAADGRADKVGAIDIKGSLWLADIWKPKHGVVRLPASDHILVRSEENLGQKSRGWGIVALPPESFVKVNTLGELVGGVPHEVHNPSTPGRQPMANIEPCLRTIPDNPCPPRARVLDGNRQVPVVIHGQDALYAIANLLGVAETGSSDGSAESDDIDEEIDQDDDDLYPEDEDSEQDEDEEDVDLDDDESFMGSLIEVEEADTGADPAEPAQNWPDDMGNVPETQEHGAGSFIAPYFTNPSFEEAFEQLPMGLPNMEGLPSLLSRLKPKRQYCPEHRRPVGHICRAPYTDPASLEEDMVYIPHLGRVEPMPTDEQNLIRLLTRPRTMNRNGNGEVKGATKRHRLLRLYEKDMEMMAPREDGTDADKEMGILCPDTLTFAGFSDRSLRPHFRASSRLNMAAYVPELALVVIASPVGKAMLVTPTQLHTPLAWTEGTWKHGLRVEWILPRESDEMGPASSRRPLHGMAIGPVQDERGLGGDASERASMPRRYRLMLHYQNHDIATYEITREEQTGKLCVF